MTKKGKNKKWVKKTGLTVSLACRDILPGALPAAGRAGARGLGTL
jgi:hypothetical protein